MPRTTFITALIIIIPTIGGCAGGYMPPANTAVDRATMAPTLARGPIEGRSTLGLPIPVPGQPTAITPFTIVTTKGVLERNDAYDRDGFDAVYRSVDRSSSLVRSYVFAQEVRWHNAFITEFFTSNQWPILTARGVISRWIVFAAPGEDQRTYASAGMAFIATIDDTNRDGQLDDRDARVAILADDAGRNPRIVTPRNAQVWNVSADVDNNVAFFLIATDTNGDGVFSIDDEALPYSIALDSTDAARPVVNSATLIEAERLLK